MGHELKVSSYQSLGACDGPSLRSVIFLYGCPLRCNYCHNPETWHGEEYALYPVEEMVKKVLRNKPYFKDGGGVTVSGGEPLLQQEAVISFFQQLKEQNIHTCIDTSASEPLREELLLLTDLFLVDVKFLLGEEYLKYVKKDIFSSVLNILQQTKKENKAIWIRHVLYPELTDNKEYLRKLLDFLEEFPQIQRIDLLPFKSICDTKYEKLNIKFPMADVKESDLERIQELKNMIPPSLRG